MLPRIKKHGIIYPLDRRTDGIQINKLRVQKLKPVAIVTTDTNNSEQAKKKKKNQQQVTMLKG
jgi:hypothetical protein